MHFLFYTTALAIMQDFQDNEKKRLKMAASRPFWISFLRNLSCVKLVWDNLFYIHGTGILHCFFSYVDVKYHKITQIQNIFLIILEILHFEIDLYEKLIRLLADIAEHIC